MPTTNGDVVSKRSVVSAQTFSTMWNFPDGANTVGSKSWNRFCSATDSAELLPPPLLYACYLIPKSFCRGPFVPFARIPDIRRPKVKYFTTRDISLKAKPGNIIRLLKNLDLSLFLLLVVFSNFKKKLNAILADIINGRIIIIMVLYKKSWSKRGKRRHERDKF